jgi:hypothetical protein
LNNLFQCIPISCQYTIKDRCNTLIDYSTSEKVHQIQTTELLTSTPTVNTTSTGSPEVLTPTSNITFADVAKRKEYDDVGLPFLVDCCGHLGSL